MFRFSSLSHRQVISPYRGNCTIYDTVCEIKPLLFNEFSFFVYKYVIEFMLTAYEQVVSCQPKRVVYS
jgi:hypothetical protein